MGTNQTCAVTSQQRSYFDAFGFLQLLSGSSPTTSTSSRSPSSKSSRTRRDPRWEMADPGLAGTSAAWRCRDFIDRHPRLAALVVGTRGRSASQPTCSAPGSEFVESDGNVFTCESEWHFDTPARADRQHVKLSVYLDPLGHDTGAPRVMPATHHQVSIRTSKLGAALGFDGAIEDRLGSPGEDLPSWTLATEPGDLIIWDFRVLHAVRTAASLRRRLISMNFRTCSDPAIHAIHACMTCSAGTRMRVRDAVLALLARGPAHGYQLKVDYERFTRSKPVNVGQIYQTLERLRARG